jgi:hypothetical protein
VTDEKRPRRIVASRYSPNSQEGAITVASVRQGGDPEVEVLLTPTARLTPKVGALLGDTFAVVQEELARMKADQARGARIKVRDLQVLGDLLFKLTKEMREDERRNDVTKLDDVEMLRAALNDPTMRELVAKILLEFE